MDVFVGYRIVQKQGRWNLWGRWENITKYFWGLWTTKEAYTVIFSVHDTREDAMNCMKLLIAETEIVITSDDFNLKGIRIHNEVSTINYY